MTAEPGGLGGTVARGRRTGRLGQTPLVRALGYLAAYRRVTLLAVGGLVVATLAQLAVPQLVQAMIDRVVTAAAGQTLLSLPAAERGPLVESMGSTIAGLEAQTSGAPAAIAIAGTIIVLFAVARGLFMFGQMYFSQVLSQNIAFDLRNGLYERIQRLSFSYHDRTRTGQLMIRATDDVERLRLFVGQGLLLALQSVLLLVGTLAILIVTNLRLTLVVLPILPIAVGLFAMFGRIAQPLFREVQQRLGDVNTVLQENMAGFQVVKAFTAEPRERTRFQAAIDSLLAQRVKVAATFSFVFPVVFLVANLGQAAILYFGGAQIVEGSLTIGEWQKFSLYLVYLFIPMGQLGFIISLAAQAAASADRIFEILDATNDIENRPGAFALTDVQGRVEFDHVSFQYFNSTEPVLNDVSFVAEPGQTVALLGTTGSGKTTIINLIPRFYDATQGTVRIDGHDVRDVTLESLRASVATVLQETNLFSDTIRGNIAFGRPDATDEEVEAAARAAAAHDFIVEFPLGYDTPVGERGSTLSGGQKQRIAIARALLMDPAILILDDSTSSVDIETEARIQSALDELMEGRTSFVIAQRLSSAKNANVILVMDKGEIVARGTHAELLDESPLYVEIIHSQFEDVDDQAMMRGA